MSKPKATPQWLAKKASELRGIVKKSSSLRIDYIDNVIEGGKVIREVKDALHQTWYNHDNNAGRHVYARWLKTDAKLADSTANAWLAFANDEDFIRKKLKEDTTHEWTFSAMRKELTAKNQKEGKGKPGSGRKKKESPIVQAAADGSALKNAQAEVAASLANIQQHHKEEAAGNTNNTGDKTGSASAETPPLVQEVKAGATKESLQIAANAAVGVLKDCSFRLGIVAQTPKEVLHADPKPFSDYLRGIIATAEKLLKKINAKPKKRVKPIKHPAAAKPTRKAG